ncbi:dihydrolipoyllysine-residue acetyltransferase [Endozoicomonadaceae bacterium StTr2]
MTEEIIKIPDIGSDSAEVIEVCANVGDKVDSEDSLIVLESDKASMEVPVSASGTIVEILVKVGDSVSEGMPMVKVAVEGAASAAAEEAPAEEPAAAPAEEVPAEAAPAPQAAAVQNQEITVPDIGAENVPVIEICVKPGDRVEKEMPIVVLESDKATMEIPSPESGVVTEICVAEGQQMNQGDLVLRMDVEGAAPAAPAAPKADAPKAAAPAPAKSAPAPAKPAAAAPAASHEQPRNKNRRLHAGPAVRRLAREFGVDLALVKATGPRGRVVKEDIQNFVKQKLNEPAPAAAAVAGTGIPAVPAVDFSKFGPVREEPLNRLRKVAATNFQRSWLNVPHVTQFDEADISEMEAFRKASKKEAELRGTKLTPMPFMVKACAVALREMPQFCASLSADGESMIYKDYVNIGMAVDTPDGLLVPVIKDADKKGLWELSEEILELAAKARDKKLKPAEMQGGCFTISSLGSIGGTAFTPIVNAPEVAILGISKAQMKPVWNGQDFDPKLMLPLSLSYDHRAINGADAARFTGLVSHLLSDIRRLLFF